MKNSTSKPEKFVSTELKNPPKAVFINEETPSKTSDIWTCKCGSDNTSLRGDSDCADYLFCRDCKRTWFPDGT